MVKASADLHIHSYYSDGTMSPEEILEEAINHNVRLLSVTDHDTIEGSLELQKLCVGKDIKFLTGVELNSLADGANYHVLCYGADLHDDAFVSFVRKNRRMLEIVNETLIGLMEKDYEEISVAEYDLFSHNRRKGGWKALQYLMAKGITGSLREGFSYYVKYNCSYSIVDFPSIKTVCEHIHKAGGKAILAHPGVSIKETDMEMFRNKLNRFLDDELDGVECYYVTHSEEITRTCLDVCQERELMITAGSDCHGDFGSARIGDVNIPVSQINLGKI